MRNGEGQLGFDIMPARRRLRELTRRIAETDIAPRAAAVDRAEEYPWDNVAVLRQAGLLGYTIPNELGGAGGDFLDAAIIVEEMARVCGVTGRIAVETNMGAISAIMRHGSAVQRQLAAQLVLDGDKPAICITEPDAGSAATEMTTRADRRPGGWVMNGRKHWITGGGVSRLHLIFARVFDPAGTPQGIGGFLAVRGEAAGLTIGARAPTMGLRGIPETEIVLDNLFVPDAMALQRDDGRLCGFAELMDAYNSQRVGAASVALGLAQGAYEAAVDFARTREQFGRPIGEFQGLQWMLADMSIQIEAARLMIHRAAASANPFPDPMAAAQAKIFASEMALKVTNDALQLFGARGYGRDLPMERMVRDARMFTIGGGTAQVLRNFVAGRVLGWKLPQTRNGYARRKAAE